MKTISIGDIHGRNYWKSIDPNNYDLIIFNGDYVDSYVHSNEVILNNLMDIIQFKKDYPDKVILLLGNHDIQYYFSPLYPCSGFRPSMASSLISIYNENKNLFKVAHQIDNIIWTHAGISEGWFNFNKKIINEVTKKFDCANLADTFNHMLSMNHNVGGNLHQVSRYRGGFYQFGGITWADKRETYYDHLKGYKQIVGHTPVDNVETFELITYIDVLSENKTVQNFYKLVIE